MKKPATLLAVAAALLILTACATTTAAASTPEDAWLRHARDVPVLDVRASEACKISPFGTDLVAAVDSTSAGVKKLEGLSRVAPGFADGLPSGDDTYAALCIWRTPPQAQVNEDYFVLWTINDGAMTRLIAGFD
jgi:hypothetical protein